MMRKSVFLLAMAALPWLSTNALSANDAPPAASPPPPPAAQACPRGTHWEPAGYIHDGKWRDARCARDNGRE